MIMINQPQSKNSSKDMSFSTIAVKLVRLVMSKTNKK